MNTTQTFALAAAILITAAVVALLADAFAFEPSPDAARAHAADAALAPKSAADRSSR